MKKLLVLAVAPFIIGCSNSSQNVQNKPIDSDTQKMLQKQAKEAIMTVGGTLKKNMVSQMKSGGPIAAAGFCSASATNLAKEVSKTLPEGISVKRITNKPRNSQNQATPSESKVLLQLESQMKSGTMPKMLVQQKSEGHYQVYKPIKVGKKCLVCHGTQNTRNQDAYNIIASNYKSDQAINYKEGDFRGAFLVDIIKNK